nr:hypothetical protein [Tanacetum cinerariifolium]
MEEMVRETRIMIRGFTEVRERGGGGEEIVGLRKRGDASIAKEFMKLHALGSNLCSKSHKNRFRGCQCAKTQYISRKATRTDLWDDTEKANKIRITLAAILFFGIQNAGAVPPVIGWTD